MNMQDPTLMMIVHICEKIITHYSTKEFMITYVDSMLMPNKYYEYNFFSMHKFIVMCLTMHE